MLKEIDIRAIQEMPIISGALDYIRAQTERAARRLDMMEEIVALTGDQELAIGIMKLADRIAATSCDDPERVANRLFYAAKCRIGIGEPVNLAAMTRLEDQRLSRYSIARSRMRNG